MKTVGGNGDIGIHVALLEVSRKAQSSIASM